MAMSTHQAPRSKHTQLLPGHHLQAGATPGGQACAGIQAVRSEGKHECTRSLGRFGSTRLVLRAQRQQNTATLLGHAARGSSLHAGANNNSRRRRARVQQQPRLALFKVCMKHQLRRCNFNKNGINHQQNPIGLIPSR